MRKLIECACGCGEQIWNMDGRGRPRRFKHRHDLKIYHSKKTGSEHYHWLGGRVMDVAGYWLVWQDDEVHKRNNGHYVKEHVLIMEKHIGRRLKPEEVVHHINGIKTDNRLENLQLCANNTEHLKAHKRKRGPDGRYL